MIKINICISYNAILPAVNSGMNFNDLIKIEYVTKESNTVSQELI